MLSTVWLCSSLLVGILGRAFRGDSVITSSGRVTSDARQQCPISAPQAILEGELGLWLTSRLSLQGRLLCLTLLPALGHRD